MKARTLLAWTALALLAAGPTLEAQQGAEKKRLRTLQHRVDRCVRRLASRSMKQRREALQELIAIGMREGFPWVPRRAVSLFDRSCRYWNAVAASRRGARAGTLQVRLSQGGLLGLDSFATTVGVGSPIRLQLPRLRRTSLGTSVRAPLGGR